MNTTTFPHIDQNQVRRHLELLGYQENDHIFLRFFYPSDDPRKDSDKGRKSNHLNWQEMENYQQQGRGTYFVVNGGGHKNNDVKFGRAVFIEHDHLDKEIQQELWRTLGLPEQPGTYQVCLKVDGEIQTESFEVQINPNEKYTRAETDAKGAFWMQLYAKAEEGIQTVLKAREAKEKVANALSSASGNQALADQGAKINSLCDQLEGSMMPVGTTLVQIINERTKLVPKLTWLHNVLETSEGPANQAVIDVYNKVASEMDQAIASFNSQLDTEMVQFDQLNS